MQLHFLGATGTVTGSRTLVASGDARILVDCGLFQGLRELRRRNWRRPEFDPRVLDAVILTHAHIDHSGFVPRLIAQGFDGPVYCTRGTADLLTLLWPDAGHLQEEDARFANKKGFSRHKLAEPLFTEEQARQALSRVRAVDWGDRLSLGPLTITWRNAGHILGASSVWVEDDSGSVLFSGDLGRSDDPLMRPPDPVTEVPDWVVMESTYGDRLHENHDVLEPLARVVERTVGRGGVLLIPSFAVGRAQAVLYGLHRLREQGRLDKRVPIFMNSPMAVDATALYRRHPDLHRLDPEATKAMCAAARLVRTVQESKELNQRHGPMIVISASGMLTGGRVLHHLEAFAGESRNTLLFVGYQAAGTRGAAILGGDRQIKVHGKLLDIRCEIERIDAWSAHADQRELLGWLKTFPAPPRHLYLNHGEPGALATLQEKVRAELGWEVSIPEMGDAFTLTPADDSGAPEPARSAWTPAARSGDALDALGADGIIRVLGGRALLEPTTAARRLADAELAAASNPQDLVLQDQVQVARRLQGLARWLDEAHRLPHLAAGAPLARVAQLAFATDGGPGVAEAVQHGASEVGLPTVALGLPDHPAPSGAVPPTLALQVEGPDARRALVADELVAIVAFPGGFGTLAEVYAHVSGALGPRPPLVLVGRAFWHQALDGELLRQEGLVSASQLVGVHYADSAEQAWQIVQDVWSGEGH